MNTQRIYAFLQEKNGVAAAIAFGICFIIGLWIVGNSFYEVHTLDQTLSVTGSATQDVTSDSAKWTVGVQRAAYLASLGAVQQQVQGDASSLKAWFVKKGIDEGSITIGPVIMDEEYSQDTNAPRRYNVHADVTVSSEDVHLIESLSHSVTDLVNQGILVVPQAPEYYVSTLPDLRVSLMGDAIKDARTRAEKIAESSQGGVGKMQSASSGVVQVMAQNSVDVSGDGSYDTSTIEKTVMVTVRAAFFLK